MIGPARLGVFSRLGHEPINVYAERIDAMRKHDEGDGQIEFDFEPVVSVPALPPAIPMAVGPTGVMAQVIQNEAVPAADG